MDPLIDARPGGASPVLATARLRLHTWSDEDAEGLYRLSTDPEVMRYFPGMPTREQVAELVEGHRNNPASGRPGLSSVTAGQAVEPVETPDRFIGFVGLATPTFPA